jgi:hypothetical protein
MILKLNNKKFFTKNETIDLMVLLSAIEANVEMKWTGPNHFISHRDLLGY